MSESTTPMLVVRNGTLYIPRSAFVDKFLLEFTEGDAIVLCSHPGGDYDTIRWPNPNRDNLASALYDHRETGHLPGNCPSVLLPDGTEFLI